MTTGGIDYSPDYKSEKTLPTIREMSGSVNFGGRVVFEGDEQVVVSGDDLKARLEREVIDAVKACRTQPGSSWDWLQPSGAHGPEVCNAWSKLETAIDALIEFESQEKKG